MPDRADEGRHAGAVGSLPLIRPLRATFSPQGEKVSPEIERAKVSTIAWTGEAEQELRKIPFFVRGKARRNTEAFAQESGIAHITLETLYDAKAHFSGR